MTFRSETDSETMSHEWYVSGSLMYPISDAHNKVLWILSTSATGAIEAVNPTQGLTPSELPSWGWHQNYAEYICVRR
jgi:hypothetical protein